MTADPLRWLVLLAPLLLGPTTTPVQAQAQAQVTLSLKEFEALYSAAKLKESEQRIESQWQRHEKEHQQRLKKLEQANKALFPKNYQVLQHTASGIYNATSDTATFDMQMTIRVIDTPSGSTDPTTNNNLWTAVPLIGNNTVASGWKIEILDEADVDKTETDDEDNKIESSSSFVPVDAVTSPNVLLLRQNDHMELATSRHGLFRVSFQSFSRVVKARNIHQLVMSQFLYPLSDFAMSVYGNVRDFSVEPVEAFWHVEPILSQQQDNDDNDHGDNNVTTTTAAAAAASNIHVTLPLTADTVEIRWLDDGGASSSEPKSKSNKEAAAAKDDDNSQSSPTPAEPEEAPQVTVIHEVMHSVDEGMVRSSHIVEFTSSGELAPVDFALMAGPETRITSIAGHALQNWEIIKTTKDKQLVRLHWKRSHLDSTATILLQTETDRSAGATKEEQVELPAVVCQDVLRQVGHVGVTKDANVEVHEQFTRGGMARCEPSEISSKLRLNMDRPIVLSYKYLNPHNASVVVNVHEHVAMETLEATVDRLHYKAVVTETHTMHSILIILQSTKLQYLELFGMPQSASMYTLAVNSVATKPVEGQRNSILVPLLVGLDPEAANAGSSLLTSVELSYISTHAQPMMAPNGTLPLSPPHLDLPISVVTSHVRLPKQFVYNFRGDFGSEPDRDLAVAVPPSYSYATGKRVVEQDYQFGFKDDYWPDEDAAKPGREQGVKIVTPNTGRSYYFHRLLVLGTKLSLNASYAEPVIPPEPLPWWSAMLQRMKNTIVARS